MAILYIFKPDDTIEIVKSLTEDEWPDYIIHPSPKIYSNCYGYIEDYGNEYFKARYQGGIFYFVEYPYALIPKEIKAKILLLKG